MRPLPDDVLDGGTIPTTLLFLSMISQTHSVRKYTAFCQNYPISSIVHTVYVGV